MKTTELWEYIEHQKKGIELGRIEREDGKVKYFTEDGREIPNNLLHLVVAATIPDKAKIDAYKKHKKKLDREAKASK